MKAPEECIFYQTVELPEFGVLNGSWDHRDTTSEYLGHVNFAKKTALDVGPANGYFSFEMEKRGAGVTAIELGQGAEWDMVPSPHFNWELAGAARAKTVSRVEKAFWFSHKILGSKVQMIYGSVYETPSLIDKIDIALMGNILQHLRDPFRAIEQVSKVVKETIIISEALWDDSPGFLNSVGMRLIPRVEYPEIDHSWWQVSPPLVIEILKLLGLGNITCNFHEQRFNGLNAAEAPIMVPHFTVTGCKLNHCFNKGWHSEENDGNNVWRWSSSSEAEVLFQNPRENNLKGDIKFGLLSPRQNEIRICLNGSDLWHGTISDEIELKYFRNLDLIRGQNNLKLFSSNKPERASASDSRYIGFAIYNFMLNFE